MVQNKKCCKCGLEKEITEFGKNSNGKFGVHSRCKICAKQYHKKWYSSCRDDKLKKNKKWKAENPDKVRDATVAWREKTKEDRAEKDRKKYAENPEIFLDRCKRYYESNKGKVFAKCALRRKRVSRQIKMLDAELKRQIEAIYSEARALTEGTGIVHHVDHIMPLAGKNFSGLHVPWNLRVVEAKDNLSKGTSALFGSGIASMSIIRQPQAQPDTEPN